MQGPPPLSCRAMTSYERCLAIHVVTLASCKLEFTVLELIVATIYHATHMNQKHGFTLASFHARGKDRTQGRSYVKAEEAAASPVFAGIK